MTKLPTDRPSRVVIEPVAPVVDGGMFAAKAALGEPVTVRADVFGDGHDAVNAALRWRHVTSKGRGGRWTEIAMEFDGNDRWHATFMPTELGRHEYEVIGWSDHPETWRHGTERKVEADVDVTVELMAGCSIVRGLLEQARAAKAAPRGDVARLEDWLAEMTAGDTTSIGADWGEIFWRYADREPIAHSGSLRLDVDPERARFSAWYEFFPRSTIAPDSGHATLRDAIDRLDYVAAMGFDVLYLPPIHPVGQVNRKGRNNTTTAESDDVGSPWGIADHLAVHPELGTLADVHALAAACRERGIELALDIAFQCTPDHPWVTEHPEWFAHRADGTIQYAENPPKKYQDIYPIDFESSDWKALWQGLAGVIRFWIDQGITIFRVDNPHTKAFPFWEWVIGDLSREYPDLIFLAEAFTRPKVMHRLAKLGFNQSYTYFAWRNTREELTEYLTEVTQGPGREYFRPNAWPNTPDILTEALQFGGRPVFMSRLVLAATLCANYGIYGPAYELAESAARDVGGEEYLDSEKYQLRHWDLDSPDSLRGLVALVNRLRRENPALQSDWNLRFFDTDNEQLICYAKATPDGENVIVVVVNLDPHHVHSGWIDLDLKAIGVEEGTTFQMHDLITGGRFLWHGARGFVMLDPQRVPAHVFRVRRRVRREQDFDYFL